MDQLFQSLRIIYRRRVLLLIGMCISSLLIACAGTPTANAPVNVPTISAPTATSTIAPLPTPTFTKDELDRQKAELELAKLRAESPFLSLSQIVTVIGGVLGLGAIILTILQGFSTLRQQATARKDEQVSKLLTALSDKEEMVRLGAARGLSRYVNDVIPEALSALRYEQSPQVRTALEEVLLGVNNEHLHRITAANSDTLSRRAYLLGRLRRAHATEDYANALLRLSPSGREIIENEYRSEVDQGKDFQGYEAHRVMTLGQSEADANLELVALCAQTAHLAESTGRVLAQLFRAERRSSELKVGLDLTLANLYRTSLPKVDLSRSLMYRSLMRHVNLDDSKLVHCDLRSCDLYDATLNNADLSRSDLTGAKLRSAIGRGAQLQAAQLDHAEFSEGTFEQADYSKAHGEKAEFKGAALSQARFDESKLTEAQFHGARLIGASFKQAECYRSVFVDADLTDAILTEAKFNGCDLRNANLSGADLKDADFRGAKLDGVKWDGVKNRETAKF
jgi:uncharacterized protein YjbI with pentapeptide repeats